MPISNVEKAALIAYDSELYTDLTIQCGNYTFKMHKAIVCPQAEFFRKLVRDKRWLEGQTGVVDMSAHAADAICAMKEFFYKGSYSTPVVRSMLQDKAEEIFDHPSSDKSDKLKSANKDEPKHRSETPTGSGSVPPPNPGPSFEEPPKLALTDQPCAMLFHLDVYQLADFIGSQRLKTLAEQNFAAAATNDWRQDEFVTAAEKVYQVSAQGGAGHKLREILVSISANHLKELCEENDRFVSIMSEVPGFGADVAMAVAGIYPGVSLSPCAFICTDCSFTGQVESPDILASNTCPGCNTIGAVIMSSKTTVHRKTYTCKSELCSFQFQAVGVDSYKTLYCPAQHWSGAASQWEQQKV